ncbi:Sec-independent protein translocase subunit TatA [Janibacter limosus]|jgi:sec-independent protein translocase protein TatA|uniref:Sec-independent protein translocase subunit TatA n=1 Tax=Janibacter limosus TaxID=53458 RepID=UPI00083429F2
MEIILILVVILLLFGFKKLPDAARSVGKSARVFKSEVNEMKEEDRQREEAKKSRESGATPTADDRPSIDEAKPRTDDQSGPVA